MSSIFEKFGIKKENKEKTSKQGKKVKDGTQKKKKTKQIKGTSKKTVKKKGNSKETVNKEKSNKGRRIEGFYKNIVRKLDTEKTAANEKLNKHSFEVDSKANKSEIKKAIESYYKVSVLKVNILNYKPKKKRFGLQEGTTKGYKKALVSIKEGDKLED